MTREATLRIPALHCGACVKTVTRLVQALAGVSVTNVDAESKEMHLSFDESEVDLDRIREALDEIGFSPDD